MHRTLRRLPSLDFLKGFEAAGRHLSFTRAAEETFVTQSALSRQVQALEEALGVPLFQRRHRSLALTPAGIAFHREVTAALGALAKAADAVRGGGHARGLTVSTTVSFASLWVIPRLAAFRARHPDVEVYVSADDRLIDLGRGEVDVAVRYMADSRVPEGAVRLFGERMMPVVSPALVRRKGTPLTTPADLARHVLLHLDDPEGRTPWLEWGIWLAANGQPGLKPAGSLRFKLYDQVIQAAVGGQGVALGRIPLIAEHLRDGRLTAPFPKRYDSARGYYAVVAPHATERADVAGFVAWLSDEAARELGHDKSPPARRRQRA
jgi:DNA-binding transcriptional LysR family regulator